MRKIFFIILGTIFLLVSKPVFSQEGEGSGKKVLKLEEIKVIGERIQSSPYPASIIKKEDIEEFTARDAGEMLRKVTGLSAVRRGAIGLDPVIRGLKEDRITLLFDGTRMYGACPGRMDPPSMHVDIDELEGLEVIRGPYSVIQGPGIMGGVINLIKRKPTRFEEFEIHGEIDSGFDSTASGKKGRLTLWGGAKPFDFQLSTGGKNYRDYRSGDSKVHDSRFRDINYDLRVGLNPTHMQRLEFGYGQGFGRDMRYPALAMDARDDDTEMYSLEYSFKEPLPRMKYLSAKLYRNRVDHLMDNKHKPTLPMMFMQTDSHTDTYGGKLETGFSFAPWGSLITGIDFYELSADNNRLMIRDMPMTMWSKIWPEAYINDLGGFIEYQLDPFPKLSTTLGFRADGVRADAQQSSPQRETNLSGNLGLIYHLMDNIDLRGSLGRGVRTANPNERYSNYFINTVDNYDYLGDPELDPEKSLQLDLGLQARFQRLNINLSAFYNQINDYISGKINPNLRPTTTGARGVKQYVNIERATLRGVELAGRLLVTPTVSLLGNLAYTWGNDEEADAPLPEIPPLEANLGLRYDDLEERFWIEMDARVVDDQDRAARSFGEDQTGGFSTFGVRGGIHLQKGYELIVGVENISDKKYHEHLNRANLPEPGINVYALVKAGF